MKLFLALLTCYFIGSIPFSYLIAKMKSGIDIRSKGSGNVGATNVYRVVGKFPALIALLLDMSKGFLPLFYLGKILPSFKFALGLSCIVGHCWSIFLKFRGGKGVATTLGVLLATYPLSLIVILPVWIITFSIYRIVSLASLVSAVILPYFALLQKMKIENVFFLSLISGIIILRHRENIKRLLKGEEKKI